MAGLQAEQNEERDDVLAQQVAARMQVTDRCAIFEAEQMKPPIERQQHVMRMADRALGLYDGCRCLQMTTQRGIGMVDGRW